MITRPPKPPDHEPSPRFRTRGEKKGKDQKRKLPEDLKPIMAELMKQSDRGAAIIAGSVLEEILEATIKARLRPLLPGQDRTLFGRMAPLSTFSAKIELGFVLGLYTEAAYKNLNMIREIRNEFAHEFDPLSFDHPEIAKLVNNPGRPRLLKSETVGAPRGEFMAAFAILGALLIGIESQDVRVSHVSETHRHVLQMMGETLKEALRTQAKHHQAATPRENTEPPQK
jgi:hypothetical protein